MYKQKKIQILVHNINIRPPVLGCTNYGDYKDERLHLWVDEVSNKYDILCIQEIFAFGSLRKNELKAKLQEYGYIYQIDSMTDGINHSIVKDCNENDQKKVKLHHHQHHHHTEKHYCEHSMHKCLVTGETNEHILVDYRRMRYWLTSKFRPVDGGCLIASRIKFLRTGRVSFSEANSWEWGVDKGAIWVQLARPVEKKQKNSCVLFGIGPSEDRIEISEGEKSYLSNGKEKYEPWYECTDEPWLNIINTHLQADWNSSNEYEVQISQLNELKEFVSEINSFVDCTNNLAGECLSACSCIRPNTLVVGDFNIDSNHTERGHTVTSVMKMEDLQQLLKKFRDYTFPGDSTPGDPPLSIDYALIQPDRLKWSEYRFHEIRINSFCVSSNPCDYGFTLLSDHYALEIIIEYEKEKE